MNDQEKLERKLGQITELSPLRIDDVDWSIKDPEYLHNRLGRTFRNFQRVEQEVNEDVLEALLPNLSEQKTDFIRIWKQQENPHGDLFAELRLQLGDAPEDFSEVDVPAINRIAGNLGRISPGLHDVFEMIYLARGAMHERLTKQGYELLSDRLANLGEFAIRNTLVKPILEQEAHHLGYYIMAARLHKRHLRPWQLYVARRLSVSSYAPVGAGAKIHKADFGHTALTLVDSVPDAQESAFMETHGWNPKRLAERRLKTFSNPIQKIGQQLLSLSEEDLLPDIVFKGIMECVEVEYEQQSRAA